MSSYVPNTKITASGTVTNDGFFPEINLADFAKSVRLSEAISVDRQRHAIQQAMIIVNFSLKSLKSKTAFISETETEIDGTAEKVLLYREAVYSHARARLMQEMRDYDYTNQGDIAEIQAMIDDEFARSEVAMRRLLRLATKHVELI